MSPKLAHLGGPKLPLSPKVSLRKAHLGDKLHSFQNQVRREKMNARRTVLRRRRLFRTSSIQHSFNVSFPFMAPRKGPARSLYMTRAAGELLKRAWSAKKAMSYPSQTIAPSHLRRDQSLLNTDISCDATSSAGAKMLPHERFR